MDVEFEKAAGRVLRFSVNYRARINDEWHEVIRYDTHHGRLHVHRFWRQKGRQIENLEPHDSGPRDYTKALNEAQADIAGRWREYRDHLRRSLSRRSDRRPL